MEKDAMIDAVRDYLDTEGFHYEFNAEKEYIKLGFNLKCKLKDIRIFCEFKPHGYLVLGICPINADKDNLGEMMRFLHQANYGLINGNFELDVRDGEVRYKCWVPTEDLENISKMIIEDSLMIPCSMMDKFGDGIAALAFGFSDAQTEIEKVTKKEEEP